MLGGQKNRSSFKKGPTFQSKKQIVEKKIDKQPEVEKENKENTEPENLEDLNTNRVELLYKENTTNSVCQTCGMSFLNEHSLSIHKENFCIGYKETTEVEMNRTDSPPLQSKYIKSRQNIIDQSNSPQTQPYNDMNNTNDSYHQTYSDDISSTNRNENFQQNRTYKNQFSMSSQFTIPTVQNSIDYEPITNSLEPVRSESKLDPRETQTFISKLNDFKKKKSVEQSLRDMEDTLIRDTIRDKKLAVTITNSPPVNTSITPINNNIFNYNMNTPSIKSSQISLRSTDPYKDLLIEYSEFKKLEKSVLQEIYHYDPSIIPFKNTENKENNKTASNDFLSLFENSEFDDFEIDYLDTISFTAPPAPSKGTNMNNEVRNNLQRINDKTIQLEKDRREIQFKLEQLRNDTSFPIPVQSNQSLNRILAELRDQQRINEAALQMLSARLIADGNQPNNVLPKHTIRTNNINNFNSKLNDGYTEKVASLFNSYIEANLSYEEIRLMRLNYLQGGGSDPVILNKFTELENEARLNQPNQIPQNYNPQPLPSSNNLIQYQYQPPQHRQNQFQQAPNDPIAIELDKKIRKVDNENRRLNAELQDLQERYQTLSSALSPNNHLDAPSPKSITPKFNYDTQPKQKRGDNSLPPISQRSPVQQNKIKYDSKQYLPPQEQVTSRNSQNSRISKEPNIQQQQQQQQKQQVQQIAQNVPTSFRNNDSTNSSRSMRLKDLDPQPYDPVGGFVIFLDFITNLDPSYSCARVITCLHHPKSGLGEPSLLPIVNTENYVENNHRTSVALVSTKQPVPRCPPQQGLTILVELQMQVNGEQKLKSCGWTKIQLFDAKNRLMSGRWKLPLKRLPIQSDSHINALGNLPDFGRSELYYRLVNLKDSEEQTNAPISPSFSSQYIPSLQEQIGSSEFEQSTAIFSTRSFNDPSTNTLK